MFLTTEQVLVAYIKTGLKPLHGSHAFAVDAEDNDLRAWMYADEQKAKQFGKAIAACPIGVMCIVKGHEACQMETGSFGEHYYDKSNHDGNTCWTDGFISGWEETERGTGYDPEGFAYTPEENPEGLAIYKRGYANGRQVRQDFIKLGLRTA
jgi:hypothetical protein